MIKKEERRRNEKMEKGEKRERAKDEKVKEK